MVPLSSSNVGVIIVSGGHRRDVAAAVATAHFPPPPPHKMGDDHGNRSKSDGQMATIVGRIRDAVVVVAPAGEVVLFLLSEWRRIRTTTAAASRIRLCSAGDSLRHRRWSRRRWDAAGSINRRLDAKRRERDCGLYDL